MCRSIKRLRGPEGAAPSEEVREAALQFVRKISGYRVPAKQSEAAFWSAVDEVAAASQDLLDALPRLRTTRRAGP